MSNRQEKEKRKRIADEIAERQKAAFENSLPMGRKQFEGLFDYLDERLSGNDCDDTNKLTKEYLKGIGQKNEEEILKWLAENAGFCDCEILANGEDLFED